MIIASLCMSLAQRDSHQFSIYLLWPIPTLQLTEHDRKKKKKKKRKKKKKKEIIVYIVLSYSKQKLSIQVSSKQVKGHPV